jgi:hypothetical protein
MKLAGAGMACVGLACVGLAGVELAGVELEGMKLAKVTCGNVCAMARQREGAACSCAVTGAAMSQKRLRQMSSRRGTDIAPSGLDPHQTGPLSGLASPCRATQTTIARAMTASHVFATGQGGSSGRIALISL